MRRTVTMAAALMMLVGITAGPVAAQASEPCEQSGSSQGTLAKGKGAHGASCVSDLAKASAKSAPHLQLARSVQGHR